MKSNRITIPDVIDRFYAYYLKHQNWGSLHVALEDGNFDNKHIEMCADFAARDRDNEGYILAGILSQMTKTQRSIISWRATFDPKAKP